ncbi:release factor glutamine methyltransferase [Rhodovulum iodosum]|uniref:Release factor glutamine methyltransferase n=1 Tax=Rhodovulum iodosum TaxID=68291 RepID=A0ABV3XVW5_9RHOB|nr:peptide chain release factor N(5)-glutamine methyltransferase [Rhodovulum robiginosum]RSK33626.1 peptide chain release factor N(5)-glutamine methyltransferase [Rhodovulum robiginosum]
MTAAEALAAAVRRLRAAGVPDAPRDARRLLAHAAGAAPERLTLILPEPLSDGAAARFDAAIARRAGREPVSHIIGTRAFYGRSFRVTGDVLDPRPETETLVEQSLAEPFSTVLDLGTGSGCILLTLLAERPGATGLGTDISEAALAIARDNAARLGVSGARFAQSEWFTAVAGQFDLIVSNPPYIAAAEMSGLAPETRDWEPHLALTPGGDGLAAYRALAAGVAAHLSPGGRCLVEVGAGQGAAVASLFRRAGLDAVAVHPDLDSRDRVVSMRAPA